MVSLAQQQCYFLFRPTRSARFECDLSGAFIDRDHGKFARAFYRKSSKVIHDRLPFLDLRDSAFPLRGGDAAPVHRAGWRQQIGRVIARVVECLDLRFKRLTCLFLATSVSLPLVLACFDRPDLSGALIDRDHGKFAGAFHWKSTQ